MDLTLKIEERENSSVVTLIKRMCEWNSRIKIDRDEGIISIIGIDEGEMQEVIDTVDDVFNIICVDIIPATQKTDPVVTEDSLEIAKIEFSDKAVEEHANKLMRVIYWSMYNSKAHYRDICRYLTSVTAEISMKYNPEELINFSVGDIVVCAYGTHLQGEPSGGYVNSIVCQIDDDGLVYVVPVTKHFIEEEKKRFLPFTDKVDVNYAVPEYTNGTVLLRQARYIRAERIKEIVGTVCPEFFEKLLKMLSETFEFTHEDYEEGFNKKLGDVQNDDEVLAQEEAEADIHVEEESKAVDMVEDTETNIPEKKIKKVSAEAYLTELLVDSLNLLDNAKPVEEQVDLFLDSVGLPKSEKIIRQAFIAACKVEKIGYRTINLELSDVFPKVRVEVLTSTMGEVFKKWLEDKPQIKEKYPKISFMVLLKVFAKRMK